MTSIYFQFDKPACEICYVTCSFNSIFPECDKCDRTYIIYNNLSEDDSNTVVKVNHLTHFHFKRLNYPKYGNQCECQLPSEVLQKWKDFNNRR